MMYLAPQIADETDPIRSTPVSYSRTSRGRLADYLDPAHPATASLHKHGVAVVRVCSEAEAAELRDALWDDLEAVGTGIRRDDPATWRGKNWLQTTHGLLQNQNFGLRTSVCLARLKCVDALKPRCSTRPSTR
jgi:hypothetical protein